MRENVNFALGAALFVFALITSGGTSLILVAALAKVLGVPLQP